MQIRIVAVGQRITEWAQSAVSDYLSRFPRDFRVELRDCLLYTSDAADE